MVDVVECVIDLVCVIDEIIDEVWELLFDLIDPRIDGGTNLAVEDPRCWYLRSRCPNGGELVIRQLSFDCATASVEVNVRCGECGDVLLQLSNRWLHRS